MAKIITNMSNLERPRGFGDVSAEANLHGGELPPILIPSAIKDVEMFTPESVLDPILLWASDRETSLHLDPPPILPHEMMDPDAVSRRRIELREYYSDPDIIPFVAFDHEGKPVAVLDMRVRNDKYISNQERFLTPVLERLIVDPERRREGIGRDLCATAIKYMFRKHTGYVENGKGRGARKIYAWSMEKAEMRQGEFEKNYKFFRRLGFSPRGNWKEIAKNAGHDFVDDAVFFALKPTWFSARLEENPRTAIIPLNKHEGKTDNAEISSEHIS